MNDSPEKAFDFLCPGCGQSLEAEESLRGERAECPSCGRLLRVPWAERPKLPALPAGGRPTPRGGLRGSTLAAGLGWCCVGAGLLCSLLPGLNRLFALPLFALSFVLSILAMAPRRPVNGGTLLLASMILPPLLWIGIVAHTVSSAVGRTAAPAPDVTPEAPTSAMIRGESKVSEPPRPAARRPVLLAKDEWKTKLRANYRMSANQITEEVEPDAFVALMGKPDRTATLGRMTYWFYNCRDGQIMMQFESETFAVFGRIIAAEINDY